MADRGDTTDGLAGPGPDGAGVRSLHDGATRQRRHPVRVHPVGAAGHDEQWRSVRAEHQAVGDRADLAAKLRGGGRRGRRRFRQFLDLPGDAMAGKHVGHVRGAGMHAGRLAPPRRAPAVI